MMHSDQLTIDIDLVGELIAEQFPPYSREPVTKIETSGTVNQIFRVGSQLTARFPLRPTEPLQHSSTLHREALAMTEFAEHCPYRAPAFIAFGKPGRDYPMPWTLQTWIPGHVATPQGFATSRELAKDVTNLILTLRGADTRGRDYDGRGRGGRLCDHDEWMTLCLKQTGSLVDTRQLRALWKQFRRLLPPPKTVMSHKDLVPQNLLVRKERIVGVLDAGDFGPADPALDLVAAWHLFDKKEREFFREQLKSSPSEWKRGAAWAFQQAMGLIWYYKDVNLVMTQLGNSTLKRILSDPMFERIECTQRRL